MASRSLSRRVAGLAVVTAVLACRTSSTPVSSGDDKPPPEVTLFGVRMQMYRGSELTMVGRAAKVEYERQSADMRADEALLRFPSRATGARAPGNAIAGLEVRAPEVVGNLYTRKAEAQGGVVLRAASGMVGQTERAQFDGLAMKVHGPEPVEITGPGYRLTARGFDFVFADESFTFIDQTETVLGGVPE